MGPNSALTSFLREQGISAAEIRRRHRQRLGNEEEQNEEEHQESNQSENDQEVEQIREAAKRKRGQDDNDDDDDSGLDEDDQDFKMATAIKGGQEKCPDCEINFIVNVYSVKNNDGKFLCKNCGHEVIKERRRQNRLRNTDAVKKQKKKIASALLDKQDYRKLSSLQDICIQMISKFIDDIDQLGDIGQLNMGKINRILSRNRRLNSSTMKLFLNSQAKELEFWDCSNIQPDSYNLIPAYAPYLEHLNLTMCGQLTNENLALIAEKLPNLKSVVLDGAFLIKKDSWAHFFETCGERLVRLDLSNTHRIDSEVIAFLVQSCPNLQRLKLNKLSGLEDSAAIHILADLSQLKHLEISYPGADEDVCEDVVTDAAMIDILSVVGPQLEALIVDGCTGLTDEFLLQGVAHCSSNLQVLSLSKLEQLTSEAFSKLMNGDTASTSSTNGESKWRLTNIDISRCVGIDKSAIKALAEANSSSLVKLNLNTLPQLTEDLDPLLDHCTNLAAIDIGFVPCVDNTFVRKLAKSCKGSLNLVTCYGVPKVTDTLEIAGVQIIGPQQTY